MRARGDAEGKAVASGATCPLFCSERPPNWLRFFPFGVLMIIDTGIGNNAGAELDLAMVTIVRLALENSRLREHLDEAAWAGVFSWPESRGRPPVGHETWRGIAEVQRPAWR